MFPALSRRIHFHYFPSGSLGRLTADRRRGAVALSADKPRDASGITCWRERLRQGQSPSLLASVVPPPPTCPCHWLESDCARLPVPPVDDAAVTGGSCSLQDGRGARRGWWVGGSALLRCLICDVAAATARARRECGSADVRSGDGFHMQMPCQVCVVAAACKVPLNNTSTCFALPPFSPLPSPVSRRSPLHSHPLHPPSPSHHRGSRDTLWQ